LAKLTAQIIDESRRALKLLSLIESKMVSRIVVDAIDWFLSSKGEY
jgi:hypothetical protein